ncbi:MAG: transglutaminase domain-containing protein [Akkermansiaceae bacterium]
MRAAILIVNLIIAYVLLSGWPESAPVWLRAGLALVVVMVAVPMSDASSKSKNRPKLRSLRAPKWLDYLYIGAVIFCIELLLLAVFTLGPETTEDLHGDVKYWLINQEKPSEATLEAPGKLSHDGAGNWLWDNHFKRSHPKQASKRPPNKPEIFLEVPSEYSQKSLSKHSIYLRTFALDHFDGDTWSIHQPTKHIIEKPEDSNIKISPVNGTWRSLLPLYRHTITQPYYSNGQNLLTTIQNTIDTNVETLTKVSTDTYILPRPEKDTLNYSYTATSQPMLLDKILELDKNIAVGETHSVYLSRVSNHSLQRKLTEFVGAIDKNLPLAQQLSVLKKLINDQCSYSLTIENENGINALENFLFVEKSGYCEFYASAAAMLCRELGIPSRIAFGWSGGKFFQESNLFVFRSKDAHAWTEIYLEGYGWVIYDTTPPTENAITESGQDETPPDLTGISEESEGDLLDEETDDMMITWLKVLITIASLIFLVITLLLIRRFTQPKQRYSSAAYVKHEPKYLQLFQKLSAKLGYSVKPGRTLMQSVQHLQDQEIDVSGLKELLDEILTYHYDTTYRNTPIDKSTESRITSELRKVMKKVERS